MTCYKSLFWLLAFSVISHAAYNYFFKKKKDDKLLSNQKEIHEVMMFSSEGEHIKKSKYSRCMITSSMDRILYYLSQPRYNLDICMYVLTNMDITTVLVKLMYRGVKIRLIVDADMAYSSGSGVRKLAKHGITVRWMKSTNLMHHKFCLVDTLSDNNKLTPFLMAGSLNWTNQAMSGNYEDCLVTSQKELVQEYQKEFERLWILFKPIIK